MPNQKSTKLQPNWNIFGHFAAALMKIKAVFCQEINPPPLPHPKKRKFVGSVLKFFMVFYFYILVVSYEQRRYIFGLKNINWPILLFLDPALRTFCTLRADKYNRYTELPELLENIISIKERIKSGRFLRIFTVAFLLFPAHAGL